MKLEIRSERAEDVAAIHVVNEQAFGRPEEANLVDLLRANEAVSLSLVATADGQVVGHILFTPLVTGELEGAGLAPMAVLPEYQRQGVGSQLIRAGIERLRQAGCPYIIVLGHPEYYPRFGFRPASQFGVTCQWEVPDEAFLLLPLNEEQVARVSGLARYRPEFSTVA